MFRSQPGPTLSRGEVSMCARKGEGNTVEFNTTTKFAFSLLETATQTLLLDLASLRVRLGSLDMSMADIVNISPPQDGERGCLCLDLRGDEQHLKEQRWYFSPDGDAKVFHRVVNILNSRGGELRGLFDEMDRERQGFISLRDVEAAVEESLPADLACLFSRKCLQTLLARTDPSHAVHSSHLSGNHKGGNAAAADPSPFPPTTPARVSFADLVCLLLDADAVDFHSLADCLLSWARVAVAGFEAGLLEVLERRSGGHSVRASVLALSLRSESSGSTTRAGDAGRPSSTLRASKIEMVHGGYYDDPLLPVFVDGETLVHRVEGVTFIQTVQREVSVADIQEGNLYLTNFRLVFRTCPPKTPSASAASMHAARGLPEPSDCVTAPLGCIAQVQRAASDSSASGPGREGASLAGPFQFRLLMKDLRLVCFSFRDDTLCDFFGCLLSGHAFPQGGSQELFAFRATRCSSNSRVRSDMAGEKDVYFAWGMYDPEEEFVRQGCLHRDHSGAPSSASDREPDAEHRLIRSYSVMGNSVNTQPGGPEAGDCSSRRRPNEGKPLWRLWSDGFQLVDSYPRAFLLPAAMTDEEIAEAARFRSRHRLPALTWCEPRSGAILARSSQPMAGITANRSLADKLLLNLYRVKGRPHESHDENKSRRLYIIDCRSKLAANANAAMGKGVENDKSLINTKVLFCGIANIHAMRASLQALARLLAPGLGQAAKPGLDGFSLPNKLLDSLRRGLGTLGLHNRADSPATQSHAAGAASAGGAGPGGVFGGAGGVPVQPHGSVRDNVHHFEIDEEAGAHGPSSSFFGQRVEETGWLEHLRLVLSSSVLVAEKLYLEESSVLVHCSDGWDRTAQVCGTAQLLLDPFYRTLKGFGVLVSKDWCGFGHKFHDRLGHGANAGSDDSKEVSPVFVQWLDVVSQLQAQFPRHFEFSEELLLFVADSAHSHLFGDFVGNSERERVDVLQADQRTHSLWGHVLKRENFAAFANPLYDPATEGPIWPQPRKVRLWERYYCRFDLDMHPRVGSGLRWREDWTGVPPRPEAERGVR